jgi:hypothetical protein
MKKVVIAFQICVFVLAGLVRAEQAAVPSDTEMVSGPEGQEEQEWFDEVHQKASTTILDTSRWIDDFFALRQFIDEENKSRVRLRLTATYYEEEDFELKPRVYVRVHLPKISEKMHLLLFASEDEKPEMETERTESIITESSDDKEASAALQYFLKETEKYNISFTGGTSFDYLYGGLRYRVEKDIGSWKGRFITKLRYYTDDGWEDLNTLDIDHAFSENWFLRATAQLDWYEEEDDIPMALMLRLYQFLGGPNHVLSYEWENHFARVQDGDLTDLWLLVRYRQKFLRDWLILELSPRVNFPEDRDWEATFGFLFRIEMHFGFLEI